MRYNNNKKIEFLRLNKGVGVMKTNNKVLELEISHYKELSQHIKALQAEQEKLRNKLVKEYFGKHEQYADKNGTVLASYVTSIMHVFSSTDFKHDHPHIYADYTREQEVHTFLVK